MKKNVVRLLAAALVGLVCFSCEKNDLVDNKLYDIQDVRLFVACEGNFMQGTASLNAIMKDGSVVTDIFRKVNNRPLGDVAQSITIMGDKMLVTLNNSEKIEVLSLQNATSLATILYPEKTISSQYIQPINEYEAIVSDLWNPFLLILDLRENKITGEIPLSAKSSKQMVVSGDKLFVSLASKKIVVISVTEKKVIKELDIPVVGDSKIVKDKNGKLWALASVRAFDSNFHMVIKNKLICFDSNSYEVVKEILLPSNYSLSTFGTRVEIHPDGETLFVTANQGELGGIYRVDITATEFPKNPCFNYSQKVEMLYNMSISPEGTIFICDALDYKQRGWVYEFSEQGELLNQSKVGIIPQYILFM